MLEKKFKVVIVGGGTAGWVAATALSNQLGKILDITLIESDDIGTVGVGEASIPTMKTFHRLAGIDERDFMRATQSTFKLGILFENWRQLNHSYIHSFGQIGKKTWLAEFHNIWLHAKRMGIAGGMEEYCPELQAAIKGRFSNNSKPPLNYAYHLDASRYASYLRTVCEKRGLKRIEGKVSRVEQDPTTGFIKSVVLESENCIAGDLFIDCTGFRGLLIEQTLKTGYDDWSHYLPMDRAIAVQTTLSGDLPAYTRSIAGESGWQWRIPLQNRMGNGIVYCSRYMSEDEAHSQLLNSVSGERLTEPRVIKFLTGRRKKLWNKNCVALGLSSGFLEPLESTSIHLVMIGIIRLMKFFPFDGWTQSLENHFNNESIIELDRIRDFIVLHYKLTERNDSKFWRDRQNQEIPEFLAERMEAFRQNGLIYPADGDLFRVDSWLQVMLGQGLEPLSYHPIGHLVSRDQLKNSLKQLSNSVATHIESLPMHARFINDYCKSG